MLKGDLVEGSGSGVETWLQEMKTTDAKQLTVKQQWLEKLKKEAQSNGRLPLFIMVLGGERWFCVPEAVFDGLSEIPEDV